MEDILTMRESKKGTLALFTGQCNPHDARSAAAAVARRTVLFPAMFGPVKILIPSSSTSFTTASSRSIQKGTRPVKCHGVDASFAGRSCAGRHPRLTACLACRDTAVATVENVAADTKSATNNSRSPARARSAPATSLPASNDVTRYLSSAVSTAKVVQRSPICLPYRSTGCFRSIKPSACTRLATAAGRCRSQSELFLWSCSRWQRFTFRV